MKCRQYTKLLYMYMKTLYHTLQFEGKHLPVQMSIQYDHNNNNKILSSNNDNFTALSLACLTEYSPGNE